MAIARFENITLNTLSFAQTTFGEQTTTQTLWFVTRSRVKSLANTVKITDKYRVYADVAEFTLNFTPNTKLIADNQHLYSVAWRGFDWRIDSVRESNDRMTTMLTCVRSDPATAV